MYMYKYFFSAWEYNLKCKISWGSMSSDLFRDHVRMHMKNGIAPICIVLIRAHLPPPSETIYVM